VAPDWPLHCHSKEAREIEGARKLDLTKTYAAPAGKAIGWRELTEMKDGEMAELAKPLNAKAGEVIFLCRSARIDRVLDRQNPFAVGLGLGAGRVSLLPLRRTVTARRPDEPAAPNQVTWEVTDARASTRFLPPCRSPPMARARSGSRPAIGHAPRRGQ